MRLLSEKGKTLALAESCTGGRIADRVTNVSGSSAVFTHGFTTYSNEAKIQMLDVPAELIEAHGAVSEQVASAMAVGALKKSEADIAVSVTGIAGPTGGTEEKPVGTVWIAVATADQTLATHYRHSRGRDFFKRVVSQNALHSIVKLLQA